MNANAAARKRRAGGANFDPSPPTPQQFQQNQNQNQNQNRGPGQGQGLTIQQVVVLVDQRLTTLETFMKETKEKQVSQPVQPVLNPVQQSSFDEETIAQLNNDMNQRFELLATELGELKDIVMKLQSYTMDVNRTLLEQKSIVPQTGESGVPTFDYSNVYTGLESNYSDLNLSSE
jgi:hypothetical protein